MNGYIKLFRQLIDWEWYSDWKVTRTFIHLLLLANFKDGNWRGQGVKRGQLITSYPKLSKALGLSIQELRTCFKKLKSTNDINSKPTGKNLLVTLVKFDVYQSNDMTEQHDDNRESTGLQQDSNTIATGLQQQRNNEKKERIKKEESFDRRTNLNLPFDVVSSNQTLNAIFEDPTNAIQLVKETFQIDVAEIDVKIAIQSFSTVAIASYDAYRGIRTIEKLKNKFIEWIPKSIKYQKTQTSANCDNKPEALDLEAYLLQHFREKDLRHFKQDGDFDRWEKQLQDSKFKLSNIAKTKSNKNFTTMFLFDCCYMSLGNRLNGSNEQRRIESLSRWYGNLSDYNQNQGDLRSLLKAKPQC